MSAIGYLFWFVVTAVALVAILVIGTLRAAEIPVRPKRTPEEQHHPRPAPSRGRLSPDARRG